MSTQLPEPPEVGGVEVPVDAGAEEDAGAEDDAGAEGDADFTASFSLMAGPDAEGDEAALDPPV